MRTLIIAEAGVNHNGDIGLAMRLIDAAADAGADVVKFQTFKAASLATPAAPKAEYQRRGVGAAESQQTMLHRLELSVDAHEALLAHCAVRGVAFFSTAFDLESLELLVRLGLQMFKVPSGEITNLPYLRRMGGLGKPVILSTGMSSVEEVRDALEALVSSGVERHDVTILHCTTEYPAPMEHVNLRAMSSMRAEFGVPVGYSDHTIGIEVAIAAVALGATVIEKHFTLDRTLPGPDHAASVEPDELAAMVRAIRNIERALGDGHKRPHAAESANRVAARKSLVAAREIIAGEAFTADNLTAKRPGGGLSPMRWDEAIGRKAPRTFAPDEPIEL